MPGAFSQIRAAAEETHADAGYRFDNATRPQLDLLAVQRTVSGAAFFADAQGRRLVPAGYAMLFTDRENSVYGYPEEASEPYRHRFLSFESAPTVASLFEQVRADYGAVVKLPAASEAASRFEDLLARYRRQQFRDVLEQTELIVALLVALYREQIAADAGGDPLERGRHFLENGFRRPINLADVAAHCGFTREHFGRSFHDRFGEAPGRYLRRLRLDHAHTMLRATALPVEEVALASGFANVNTFGRAYRAHFGTSPTGGRPGRP